jgi:hypothetical protein
MDKGNVRKKTFSLSFITSFALVSLGDGCGCRVFRGVVAVSCMKLTRRTVGHPLVA